MQHQSLNFLPVIIIWLYPLEEVYETEIAWLNYSTLCCLYSFPDNVLRNSSSLFAVTKATRSVRTHTDALSATKYFLPVYRTAISWSLHRHEGERVCIISLIWCLLQQYTCYRHLSFINSQKLNVHNSDTWVRLKIHFQIHRKSADQNKSFQNAFTQHHIENKKFEMSW